MYLSFSPPKPLPILPSPSLSACFHINCDMEVAFKGHAWPWTLRVSWGYAGGLIEEQKV